MCGSDSPELCNSDGIYQNMNENRSLVHLCQQYKSQVIQSSVGQEYFGQLLSLVHTMMLSLESWLLSLSPPVMCIDMSCVSAYIPVVVTSIHTQNLSADACVCILNWCLLLWLRIHIKAPEMLQLKLEPTCFVERKLVMPFPLLSPKDRHLFLQLLQLAGRGREKEATLNFSAQRAMKCTPEIHLRTHGLLIYRLD